MKQFNKHSPKLNVLGIILMVMGFGLIIWRSTHHIDIVQRMREAAAVWSDPVTLIGLACLIGGYVLSGKDW